MAGYLPADADVLVPVGTFWFSEFWSVRSPNHNRKYLFWIWHIEVHKRGQTFGLLGKMNASNSPTNSGCFAHVDFFASAAVSSFVCACAMRHAVKQSINKSAARRGCMNIATVLAIS
jgi:hypothetical protein